MKWTINHLEDLNKVAAEFFGLCRRQNYFCFVRTDGSREDYFCKGRRSLSGVTDDVSSPTFALVNEYQTKNGKSLYHFDFYRVNHIAEALDFGYEEYFFSGDRCFIEWPEKIDELLPEGIVDCYFTENPDGSRELKVEI